MEQLLIVMLISATSFAQNLVPNPGFEIFDTCPNAPNQINRAAPWKGHGITPDYFNSCNLGSFYSNPVNLGGYQQPLSGEGYAFAGMYGYADQREYIGVQLNSPMDVGVSYSITINVSISIKEDIMSCVATNGIGAKFFIGDPGELFPDNNPDIFTTLIISDSAGWTELNYTFIPSEPFDYMVIGNFFDNANSSIITTIQGCQAQFALYFIDDVCVTSNPLDCSSQAGLQESNIECNVYPNPVNTSLEITSKLKINSVRLVSTSGKVVIDEMVNSNNHKFDVSKYDKGIYILEIEMKYGSMHYKQILLE